MNPIIQNLNLDLCTACDRKCPNCCAGIGIFRAPVFHDWTYFERAAHWLSGIPRVNLTGGEPTLHPHFAQFAPRFKDLFGCERLTMITNGWGVQRYAEVIEQHIDGVEFSDYATEQSWTALDALRDIERHKPGFTLSVYFAGLNADNFTPRDRRVGTQPCNRACWRGGTVAYADGRLYPCCVMPGIEGAPWVSLSPYWDVQVLSAPLSCGTCWFGE